MDYEREKEIVWSAPKIPPKDGIDRSLKSKLTKEVIETVTDKDRITGFTTPFQELNNMVGGIKLKTLIVLIAGTGTGKTILGLNILLHMADHHNLPVTYIDLENGLQLSIERILSMKFKLNKSFFLDPKNNEKIEEYRNKLSNISYYDHTEVREMQLRDRVLPTDQPKKRLDVILDIVRAEAAKGCKIFLIDPLQAIVEDKRYEFYEQGEVAYALRYIAEELNIAIILCHHLNKGGKKSYAKTMDDAEDTDYIIPTTDSLKGSSKISEAANEVWGLLRFHAAPTPAARSKSMLKVIKNRTGNSGNIALRFDETTYNFKPFNKNIEEDLKSIFGMPE